MSVEEMAQAHLNTIQKTIVDLQNQRVTIENEIVRLTEYLQRGVALLEERQNLTSTATVSDSSL
jgi:anion-transporting  ArsA/GET3 family ATPase